VTLDLDALLGAAVEAAEAAGSIVRDAFAAPTNVREKRPGDLVSDADFASERSIRNALALAAPDIAFVGEEEGGQRAEVGWFVDPLDGTANFVHGFPVVGVSIALVEHDVPVLGVVHAPMLGLLYSARRGAVPTATVPRSA
jgi:myo-inositol-1(or 4)-monophosphatase